MIDKGQLDPNITLMLNQDPIRFKYGPRLNHNTNN